VRFFLTVLVALGLGVGLTALSSPAQTSGLASAAGRIGACPALSHAEALSTRPGGGVLHADVDGDGFGDTVRIRYAPSAPSSCGFLLVVEMHRVALAVRVPESYKAENLPVRKWPWREPFVAAIVRLAPHRSQIVVARESGASVVNVSLYGVVGGRLRLLLFHPARYRAELPLGGTVGTGSTNVQCRRGGPLIVLSVGPTSATGKRYAFWKSTYRLGLHGFSLTGKRTIVGTDRHISALAHRAGFDSRLFASCTLARGRRP
jgi:hypothetical protein